jgi:hypothetical protein
VAQARQPNFATQAFARLARAPPGTSRALPGNVRIAFHALLVGCIAACTLPGSPRQPIEPSWPTLEPTGASYNSRVVALRTSLGRAAIRLEMRGAHDEIRTSTCADASARRLQTGCARCVLAGESDQLAELTLDAITNAFARYPTGFLAASRIEHVALCTELEYEDLARDVGTAGTVDYQQRRLFVSVEPFLGRVYDGSAAFTIEDIVHHELFHLIEYEHMRVDMSDPEWRLHNPIGFEYRAAAPAGERPRGFVNSYAQTNEIEDRASTYQYMMARPTELCELAAIDPAVRAKARLIRARVGKLAGSEALFDLPRCAAMN